MKSEGGSQIQPKSSQPGAAHAAGGAGDADETPEGAISIHIQPNQQKQAAGAQDQKLDPQPFGYNSSHNHASMEAL